MNITMKDQREKRESDKKSFKSKKEVVDKGSLIYDIRKKILEFGPSSLFSSLSTNIQFCSELTSILDVL